VLANRQLPRGPPTTRDPGPLHQPPHRAPACGQLGGDLGQQPLPLDNPIDQVRPHVDEAERGHPRSDPLLGVAASLPGQPLRPGWQHDPQRGQRLGDGPLGRAELGREPGDAVAGIAAGLQVAAQVGEPKLAGASLQPSDAAVVNHKAAGHERSAPPTRTMPTCPCPTGPRGDWCRQGTGYRWSRRRRSSR
jgi:hypothetical protein